MVCSVRCRTQRPADCCCSTPSPLFPFGVAAPYAVPDVATIAIPVMPGERLPGPRGPQGRTCGNQSTSRPGGDIRAVGKFSRRLWPHRGRGVFSNRESRTNAVRQRMFFAGGPPPTDRPKKAARPTPRRPPEAHCRTGRPRTGAAAEAKSQRGDPPGLSASAGDG